MSKGIVVVGGAEEEHYNLLGEDRLRPIINVRPEGNDIYNKLESLLANTNKISQLSADSIEYIKIYPLIFAPRLRDNASDKKEVWVSG